MISPESFTLLMLAVGLAWLWFTSRRAAEIAGAACKRACEDMNLQFLDLAVALTGLGLARNRDGTVQILRQFRFEFSTSGADRRTGRVTMLGTNVEMVSLDQPDGTTVITPEKATVHRLN